MDAGGGCCFLLQGSSPPGDQARVSCIAGRFFTILATMEASNDHLQKLETSWMCACVMGTLMWKSRGPHPWGGTQEQIEFMGHRGAGEGEPPRHPPLSTHVCLVGQSCPPHCSKVRAKWCSYSKGEGTQCLQTARLPDWGRGFVAKQVPLQSSLSFLCAHSDLLN